MIATDNKKLDYYMLYKIKGYLHPTIRGSLRRFTHIRLKI